MDSASKLPTLLIVDEAADVRESVTDFMVARGVSVQMADSVAAAVELLGASPIDVLVVSLSLEGALELLKTAPTCSPSIRLLGLSSASARDLGAAYRAGALRVLARPLSLLELAEAVRLALDSVTGLHGVLHRLSLVDVLQMFHHAAQTVHLHLYGGVEGEISLLHGNLVDAHCEELSGPAALSKLLTTQVGHLESAPLTHLRRTLSGPFDHVLLDALRALDESTREAEGPDELGDDWFADPERPEFVDRVELLAWLREFSPGAGVWTIDPATGAVERLDKPGDHPETELAGTPGSIGWAYELAEQADQSWTRVELVSGSIGVALVRVNSLTFAFARLITGEAIQRRFHAEVARLTSWLSHHVESRA